MGHGPNRKISTRQIKLVFPADVWWNVNFSDTFGFNSYLMLRKGASWLTTVRTTAIESGGCMGGTSLVQDGSTRVHDRLASFLSMIWTRNKNPPKLNHQHHIKHLKQTLTLFRFITFFIGNLGGRGSFHHSNAYFTSRPVKYDHPPIDHKCFLTSSLLWQG